MSATVGENIFSGGADLLAMLDGDPGRAEERPDYGVNSTGRRVEASLPAPPTIRVENLRELRDRPLETVPTVGGRRLVRGEVCSVAARAGYGKTTIVRATLAHSAVGRNYLGFEFAEPIRSAYFSGEGSGPLWRQAMLGVADFFDLDDAALERIAVVEGGGPTELKLSRADDLNRIRGVLDPLKSGDGLDLAVFDPFQRFAPGDENSSRDMGVATDALLALAAEFDVALLVPHHASQNGKGLDAFRGHTTFEGAIATGLVLSAPAPGERVLEAPKVRYSTSIADERTILLDFDADARVYSERPGLGAKTKTGWLLEALADGEWHKVSNLVDELDLPRSTFREGYVVPALERGLIDSRKGEKNALLVRLHDPATTFDVDA